MQRGKSPGHDGLSVEHLKYAGPHLPRINSVRWEGSWSESYRLECGVRQGGLSSPTLFNLYVDDLIAELSGTKVGCHIDGICVNNISYADNMVMLSASGCGLRRLLAICEQYAVAHGLKYNAKKSQVMVFEAGSKRMPDLPAIFLDGTELQRVHTFKYLGHVLASDLKDDADIERERRAFLWAGCTRGAYSVLRVQYNNAFRMLLRLPRFCSASGMFAEARVDCFFTTMRKRCASLVRRVRASTNSILSMIASRLDCPYMRHCCETSGGHVPRLSHDCPLPGYAASVLKKPSELI
ncbi:unnamed protein product [Plutella xylostella]|uniref:(diamondback moth) hypothetical protein n=1 Tax=Plutella xylostella TaxID=51655 RepID=A0A8S4GCM5_PLUXY|nr:unnamed protein product [Plutella xylostella]